MPLNPSHPRYFEQFSAKAGGNKPAVLEGAQPLPPPDLIKGVAKDQMAKTQKAAAQIRHTMDAQDTEEGRVTTSAPEPGDSASPPRRMVTTKELLERMPKP